MNLPSWISLLLLLAAQFPTVDMGISPEFFIHKIELLAKNRLSTLL
jgi:hypothetical protein